MSKAAFSSLVCFLMLCPLSTFAVDGVVLINQASVMAAGGFPYVISQSGSYRLSGNLTVPSGVDGIDINADNVTLDLNGFTISGPVACDGSIIRTTTTCTGTAGTGVLAFQNNVTVRNGTIRGMADGIFHQGAGVVVEEVHAFNNSSTGIEVVFSGVVRRNTANNNGGIGILAQAGVITQNVTNGNKSTGIVADTAVVSENTAWLNGGDGISAGGNSKVTDNTSNDNSGFGLSLFNGLYGSNQFQNNRTGSVSGTGGVSQNNNNCAGSLC